MPEWELQDDIVSIIVRLEQLDREGLREHDGPWDPIVLDRIYTCDIPRLKRYVSREMRRQCGDLIKWDS